MKIQDALDLHLKEEASRIVGERHRFDAPLALQDGEGSQRTIVHDEHVQVIREGGMPVLLAIGLRSYRILRNIQCIILNSRSTAFGCTGFHIGHQCVDAFAVGGLDQIRKTTIPVHGDRTVGAAQNNGVGIGHGRTTEATKTQRGGAP